MSTEASEKSEKEVSEAEQNDGRRLLQIKKIKRGSGSSRLSTLAASDWSTP